MTTVRVYSGKVGTEPYRFARTWIRPGNRRAQKCVKKLLSECGVGDNELAGKVVHVNMTLALADLGWRDCPAVPRDSHDVAPLALCDAQA
jgi:hypothetical protein